MKKTKLVPLVMLSAGLLLAVVGWFVLPSELTLQFGLSGGNGAGSPKSLSLIVSFLLCAFGAVGHLVNEEKRHYLFISGLGLLLLVLAFALNLPRML